MYKLFFALGLFANISYAQVVPSMSSEAISQEVQRSRQEIQQIIEHFENNRNHNLSFNHADYAKVSGEFLRKLKKEMKDYENFLTQDLLGPLDRTVNEYLSISASLNYDKTQRDYLLQNLYKTGVRQATTATAQNSKRILRILDSMGEKNFATFDVNISSKLKVSQVYQTSEWYPDKTPFTNSLIKHHPGYKVIMEMGCYSQSCVSLMSADLMRFSRSFFETFVTRKISIDLDLKLDRRLTIQSSEIKNKSVADLIGGSEQSFYFQFGLTADYSKIFSAPLPNGFYSLPFDIDQSTLDQLRVDEALALKKERLNNVETLAHFVKNKDISEVCSQEVYVKFRDFSEKYRSFLTKEERQLFEVIVSKQRIIKRMLKDCPSLLKTQD